jgi:lipoyl(octanoyl) transferase
MAYGDALELQRGIAARRIQGTIADDVLLLVEHHHVVTLGRGSKQAHLMATPEALAARGVELFEVERGGDVTYHGPGQLVGYPILDLKRHRQDLHWYLRQVEDAIIQTLGAFGLAGSQHAGYTGVWVESVGGRRKIASIGVHAKDWVTWHGFALNVTTDLSYFDVMTPCGIPGVEMTSMARELGDLAPPMDAVAREVGRTFARVFGLELAALDANTLARTGSLGAI